MTNTVASAANIKNNIFGGENYLLAVTFGTGINYNGYIDCSTFNCFDGTSTFSAWQSTCSCDAKSISFISGYGGVSSTTGALQPGSPMIGTGIDLTGAVSAWPPAQQNALLTDRNGNARGTNWDIGAFAYVPVAPPSNLEVITQ